MTINVQPSSKSTSKRSPVGAAKDALNRVVDHPSFRRVLSVVQRLMITAFVVYVGAVFVSMTPFIQTHITFAHRIHFFGYNRFEHPEYYGISPGKAVNLRVPSADNSTQLGAWFIYADSFYRNHISDPYAPNSEVLGSTTQDERISQAIASRPTILYFHGNSGTRALPLRIFLYKSWTSLLDANVFVIDYRGYADSPGEPTIPGVTSDVIGAWHWLREKGAKPEDVLLLGHSLGTAITGILAAHLGEEGVKPRGVVLMSPFSSIRKLMDEYHLFGFLPLLKPLSRLPLAPRVINWSTVHKFDTYTLIPYMDSAPVLLVHAVDDFDIPVAHASLLFDGFLEPHLHKAIQAASPDMQMKTISRPVGASNNANVEWYAGVSAHPQQHLENEEEGHARLRAQVRTRLVNSTEIPHFGTLDQFRDEEKGRRVVLLKTLVGGHDVGQVEGVQDVIGKMFDLGPGRK